MDNIALGPTFISALLASCCCVAVLSGANAVRANSSLQAEPRSPAGDRSNRTGSFAAAPGRSPALRELARPLDFHFGVAVNMKVLHRQAAYGPLIAREFSTVTAEKAMKLDALQPQRARYEFRTADRLIDFTTREQLQVRGHTLVWHRALPDWLLQGNWTRQEAIALLRDHIETVVGRYRGNIAVWDVVNEAIADDGTLRDSFWLRAIGPEYIEMAFRWAHAADPEALLFYNDYGGEGLNGKSDAIYALVRRLRASGVPIHGVGLQMHVPVDSPPPAADVAGNMRRLADLGLEVQITEMDVRILQPATAADYERQGEVYWDMLRVCLQAENCNTFVVWGLSDRHSWVPRRFEGWGEALLFDAAYEAKPAYERLLEELSIYQHNNRAPEDLNSSF